MNFIYKKKSLTILFSIMNIFVYGYNFIPAEEKDDSAKIFINVEVAPTFPGGYDSLQQYFRSEVKLSNLFIKAKVHYRINSTVLINSSGEITQEWVGGLIGYGVKESIVKAISKMPKWSPAYHNGKSVNVFYRLPMIIVDYKNGLSLDSNFNIIDTLENEYFENENLKWNAFFGYRKHSVFYDKGIEDLKENDFIGAIKKFNNALVADPYDADVLGARAFTYFKLNKNEIGCDDSRYAAYLSEFKDSILVINSMSYCVADYFFNKELFLSDGIVIPPLQHKTNEIKVNLIKPPMFPWGLDSLYKFLGANFKIEEGIDYSQFNSRVLVRFKVLKDGTIVNSNVIFYDNGILVKEAKRLVSNMPKWIPAYEGDLAIDVDYIFPIINFKYKRGYYFEKSNRTFNMGLKLLKELKYNDAASLFTEIIANDSIDIQSRYNRGVCYLMMGDNKRACYDWSINALHSDMNSVKFLDRFCDSAVVIDHDTISTIAFKINLNKPANSISLPTFPGGIKEMEKFISELVPVESKYKTFKSQIHINCFVKRNGQILYPRVVESYDTEIKEEAIRIINQMPNFIPATIDDLPVDMQVNIPIRFDYK